MSVESALAVYQEYEELIARSGSPVMGLLRPPHPDPAAAIDLVLPGRVLPDDLVAWWTWHDGTALKDTSVGPLLDRTAIANNPFRSLQDTLDHRGLLLRIAAQAAEDELPADMFWPSTWLPVVSSQDDDIALDLASSTREGGDIYYQTGISGELAAYAPVVTRQWTEIVGWWSTLLRVGATTWNPQRGMGMWETNEDLVPDELKGNPIAYGVRRDRYDPRFLPRAYS